MTVNVSEHKFMIESILKAQGRVVVMMPKQKFVIENILKHTFMIEHFQSTNL